MDEAGRGVWMGAPESPASLWFRDACALRPVLLRNHISNERKTPGMEKVRQLAEALASDLQVHEHEEGVLQVNVVADAILQALEKSARSKAVLRKLLEELQLRAGHRRAEIEKGIRP